MSRNELTQTRTQAICFALPYHFLYTTLEFSGITEAFEIHFLKSLPELPPIKKINSGYKLFLLFSYSGNGMLTICTSNIVLLLYSLIALAKYFIFPQLTAMHYGYSSPLQLLLSPVTMVKSLLLLLVGLPSTLLYRFPHEHVASVAVSEMVRLANICAGIHFFEFCWLWD